MKIQHIPVKCEPCGHSYSAEIVVEAPIDVAIASIKAIRCPKCNAGPKGQMLTAPDRPLPVRNQHEQPRT